MRRSIPVAFLTLGIGLWGAALARAQTAAPQPPQHPASPENDPIIVTGERIRVEAGEWEFRRWPSMTFPISSEDESPMQAQRRRAPAISPGSRWKLCIPDGELEISVRRLLDDSPDRVRELGCSPVRVTIKGDRVSGQRSCANFGITRSTRLSGKLRPASLDVTSTTVSERPMGAGSEMRWRLTAERTGPCPQ